MTRSKKRNQKKANVYAEEVNFSGFEKFAGEVFFSYAF